MTIIPSVVSLVVLDPVVLPWVDMSSPHLPETVREIDANPASFHAEEV